MFMPIKPADLPEERAALARWLATVAPRLWAVMVELGSSASFWIPPRLLDSPPQQVAAELALAERKRVEPRPCFFVTADVTAVAIATGGCLPAAALWPELLPAESGMIVLGAAIAAGSAGTGGGARRGQTYPSSRSSGGRCTTLARTGTVPGSGSRTTPTSPL